MNPYDEGYQAGLDDSYDNPYPYDTVDYEDYEDGYWEGQYVSGHENE